MKLVERGKALRDGVEAVLATTQLPELRVARIYGVALRDRVATEQTIVNIPPTKNGQLEPPSGSIPLTSQDFR